MNKIGVSFKMDVSKIDKARIYKGEKGNYLSFTAFIDLNNLDQHGNSGMITQDVSKEERAQGVKGAILGNSKVFWKDVGQSQPQNGYQQPNNQQQQQQQTKQGFNDFDSDLDF